MKRKKLIAILLVLAMVAGICYQSSSESEAASVMKKTAQVKNLKVKKKTAKTITLKWKKVKNADGYKVYKASKKKGKYKVAATLKKGSKTSVKIKGLKKNKIYYFKVRAYDKVKGRTVYSKYSKILKVRTRKSDKTNNSEKTTEKKTEETTEKTTEKKTTEDSTEKKSEEKSEDKSEEKSEESSEEKTEDKSEESTEEKHNDLVSHEQNLDFSESIEKISNPDQGFYTTFPIKITETGLSYESYLVASSKKNDLVHLRCDISAFSGQVNGSGDLDLTEAVLADLDSLMSNLYQNNRSAIIRFCYAPGFGNAKDKEPSLDQIKEHIRQLSGVLNNYPDVLTAIEAGMIGPWGEMHSSQMAKDKEVNNAIIEAWLDNTDDIPILVRTPDRIYDYLNKSFDEVSDYTIPSSHKEYRLGVFNDGYLASETDDGTYKIEKAKEVVWLAKQTEHLPYGGEVTEPYADKKFYHHIDNCIPDMFQIHLSYLNYEWNNTVVQTEWEKEQVYTEASGDDELYYGLSAYTYIENHMGYRFVPISSTISYNEKRDVVKIETTIKNKGFGNLNKKKTLSVLFVDRDTKDVITKKVGNYTGEETLSKTIIFEEGELSSDKNYDVYLKIDNGNDRYGIRFANNLWNDDLKANKIGEISPAK